MADEIVTSAAPTAAQPSVESAAPAALAEKVVATAPEVKVAAPIEPTILGFDDVTEKPEEKKEVDAPVLEPEKKPDADTEVKTDTPDSKPTEKPVDTEKKIDDGAEKQPEAEKKEESSQSDEPAPLPSFEPWQFPEGITVDEARVAEINKMFGEFERDAKVEHSVLQKFGQQIIDRHVSEVTAVAEKIKEAYDQAWKDQTKNWREQFIKDPEIGGNRQETSTAAAREFIRRHGGTPEQQAEIRTVMQTTGLGNHPAFIRLFAKANVNLAEPTLVPAGKPPAQPQSRKQKFYGKK